MAATISRNKYKKFADSETQLDIDEAILDYLLYTATQDLLDQELAQKYDSTAAAGRQRAEIVFQMVESFLIIFQSIHPEYHGSSITQFRLSLLRFTTLFTRRTEDSKSNPSSAALLSLRSQHHERAQAFLSHYNVTAGLDLSAFDNSTPIAKCCRGQQRPLILEKFISTGSPRGYHGSSRSISLLDTLPSFMALSAAQNILQGNHITILWMELAARYMAEAVLEQYLIYGAEGPGVIREAFAYGFNVESIAQADNEDLRITNMFWGGENECEIPGWKNIRYEHLSALLPPDGVSLQDHLHSLEAEVLSLIDFQEKLLKFLGKLLRAQPEPVLMQIERGKIDGVSRKDTQALKEKVLFA